MDLCEEAVEPDTAENLNTIGFWRRVPTIIDDLIQVVDK